MGWERVDAPRRGRRGYFARRAVVEPTSGPSGCGWENGRGQVGAGGTMVGADVPGGPSPARNAAGRPTTEPRVGVGCRRARGTRAPTNVGAIVRQGQPTWETRADATRRGRRGYFARQAVGGRLWIWPWVGCWSTAAQGPAATSAALPCGRGCRGRGISHRSSSEVKSRVPKPAARRRAKYPRRPRRGTSKQGPAQGPAATSAALPCGRGCRGRAISRRNSSAGAIRGASAREVPAPPSARDVQAGPAQGPAATSAALPCGRGCRGRAISRRSSSEVKSRIPKPAAGGPQLCGPQDLIAEG